MNEHRGTDWLALASRSPRRVQLLREHGFEPTIIELDVDDSDIHVRDSKPEQTAMALAYFKAAAGAAHSIGSQRLILAADTFVVKDGAIIGKPRDASHADAMVQSLSGGAHSVITGVALIDLRSSSESAERWLFADVANVVVGDIPDASREAYIASGDWRGKAGAYNLDERLRAGWPITFTGDPGAIMGLPMRRLSPMLHQLAAHSTSGITAR